MPRKTPISNKKRRGQLLRKRAVKRGDVLPTDQQPTKLHKNRFTITQQVSTSVRSSRKLESSFTKLSPNFLDLTRTLAATLNLQRPIPYTVAILPEDWLEHPADDQDGPTRDDQQIVSLVCPKRPKWRYDMSKEEVEKNEEGLFKKWLAQTDNSVQKWCSNGLQLEATDPAKNKDQATERPSKMPHAPTSFERNLEVWRQLYVYFSFEYHI